MNRREGKPRRVKGSRREKLLSTFALSYIDNCRNKRFSVPARKDHFHTKEIIKRIRYRVSGRPAPIHSALLGGADHREVMA
jgi:hypothetical protein